MPASPCATGAVPPKKPPPWNEGSRPPAVIRGLGRNIECLQVRLSPVVASVALGASAEMGGTVVALSDLWRRDAARFQEQLRAAASWDERFAIAEAALARRQEAGRAGLMETGGMLRNRIDLPLRGPRYGMDAPAVPAVLGAAGAACGLAAARRRPRRIATGIAGAVLLASTGVYLHTTLRGKLRIWQRELDHAGLKGDEQLLDLGCGRGAVLIEAARRLPAGRAVGVDLWTSDQSGNSPEATLANAAAAGVADRVEVRTADITSLPFEDDSFDVVTSALVIHNIPVPGARYRAVDEAMRVLRPGGQLLIADPWWMARQYAAHIGQGTLRGLGPGYWYGGPWFGATLLHAVKER